jgi:hypothetical protein
MPKRKLVAISSPILRMMSSINAMLYQNQSSQIYNLFRCFARALFNYFDLT